MSVFEDVSKEPQRRSIIWQHFLLNKSDGQAKCKLCLDKNFTKLVYTKNGCTKTALDHLKLHGIGGQWKVMENSEKQRSVFEQRETAQEAVSRLAVDGAPFRFIAESEMMRKGFSVSFQQYFSLHIFPPFFLMLLSKCQYILQG